MSLKCKFYKRNYSELRYLDYYHLIIEYRQKQLNKD